MRRALGVERVPPVEISAIGDAVEFCQDGFGLGAREANFDAGFVAGATFQFLRGAEGDDFAVIDDGDAVTEGVRLLRCNAWS